MNKTRRTTANIPEELLKQAIRITNKGITETLIEGLRLIKRSAAFDKAQKLRGKIKLDLDLDTSRERISR